MNNYDSMTVDELLFEYAEWARNHVGTHWEIHGTQGVVVDDENPLNVVARKHAIVAAIRKAVVREASVGTMKCLRRPIMGCSQYGDEFQTGHIDEQVTEPPCLPDGTYDLIPREVK